MSTPTIGIDLGTNFSCVGIWQNDHVEIISNERGNRTTPSVVAFNDEERLIGEDALQQIHNNPSNTIYGVKRLIGRTFDEPSVQEDINTLSYTVVNDNSVPTIEVEFKGQVQKLRPEAVSAMILEKMKSIASDFIGVEIKSAVITVPAYFNDAQRNATMSAAKVAGLDVKKIINEPTAAALAYGLDKKFPKGGKNVVVFDLGGGTFDISILNLEDGVFEVKNTGGDSHLGGYDFDMRMAQHLIEEFKKKNKGMDPSKNKRSIHKLRVACETAKKTLSTLTQASIEIDSLFEGIDFYTNISRAKFEDICSDLFKKTIDIMETTLTNTIDKSKIDEVILVGGSSRIPKIQQLVTSFFNGKEPLAGINPDEAVAYGAAVQAAISSQVDTSSIIKNTLVLDILPLSLGVETSKGIMTTVLKRKTTLPITKTMAFTTARDGQNNVLIRIFEGERLNVNKNRLIGYFELKNLSGMPRGCEIIEITFDVDSSGILTVTAADRKNINNSESIQIKRTKGALTIDQIEQMIVDAEAYKNEEESMKRRIEKRDEIITYLVNSTNSINEMKDTIQESEYQAVCKPLNDLFNWLDENPTANERELNEQFTTCRATIDQLISARLSYQNS